MFWGTLKVHRHKHVAEVVREGAAEHDLATCGLGLLGLGVDSGLRFRKLGLGF